MNRASARADGPFAHARKRGDSGLLTPDFELWRLWNFDEAESPGGGTGHLTHFPWDLES